MTTAYVHWKRLCVRIHVQECKYRCCTNTVGFVMQKVFSWISPGVCCILEEYMCGKMNW
jgi:hypothetical protein